MTVIYYHDHTQSPTSYHTQQLASHSYGSNSVPNTIPQQTIQNQRQRGQSNISNGHHHNHNHNGHGNFNNDNMNTNMQRSTSQQSAQNTHKLPPVPEPKTVYLSSLIEGVVDDIVRARYDIPVYKYAANLLKNANYEINSLYFAGHSMGGSIGMAVAAQLFGIYKQENAKYFDKNKELEIKSFVVNASGMLYNSRKFSLDAYDVYSTATVVKTNYDILSEIDEKGTYLLDCHKIGAIIYELGTKCNVYIQIILQ